MYLRRPTITESLTVIAIVVLLIALIFPGAQWASSGSIRLPVRVLVFDAVGGLPIPGAHVAIFRAPPLQGPKSLEENRDRYDPTNMDGNANFPGGVSEADGTVVIDYDFRTGANHERPTPFAHLRWTWVHVQAAGYRGVVVPVRHESQPVGTLRAQKELLVPVGLTPVK